LHGEHALRKWAELGDAVDRKRKVIRTIANIRLLPADKTSMKRRGRAFGERVAWRWWLGPDEDAATFGTE
jgi:hypothetical protein